MIHDPMPGAADYHEKAAQQSVAEWLAELAAKQKQYESLLKVQRKEEAIDSDYRARQVSLGNEGTAVTNKRKVLEFDVLEEVISNTACAVADLGQSIAK